MPTYQMTCAVCGEERWPTLADRPESYTCVRCQSQPPRLRGGILSTQERGRRASQARWAKRRAAGPPDAPGSSTEPDLGWWRFA